MDKFKEYSATIPEEITEAINSVDIHYACSDICTRLSLKPEHKSILEKSLLSFLEKIWYNKQTKLDISAFDSLDIKKTLALKKEIYEKVFLRLVQLLDERGLNDSNVLFKVKDLRLTAYKLYDGTYISHENDRLIYKKAEYCRVGFFSKRYYHIVFLEADYPDKGRWGDFRPISIWLDTEEEVQTFLIQLNKAIKVGNFIYYLDIFKRFELDSA